MHCRYCDEEHDERYLCDPAQRILTALYARGASGDMPTIELPEPMPLIGGFESDSDQVLAMMTVQAGTVPVADVPYPLLVFSGRTAQGKVLPRWLLVADSDTLRRHARLVRDMTELAIRTAKLQRSQLRQKDTSA